MRNMIRMYLKHFETIQQIKLAEWRFAMFKFYHVLVASQILNILCWPHRGVESRGGYQKWVVCMYVLSINNKRLIYVNTWSSGSLTSLLSRRPVREQNRWKRTTETISRCKDFMSDEIDVTAASGQPGSPTVLSEGQMSFPETHTHKHT